MVVSVPASNRAHAPLLMTLATVFPPADLMEAVELQQSAMWATLRLLAVPLIVFIILHFGRRAG